MVAVPLWIFVLMNTASIATEYMNDHIYLSCGERYEDMIDHRSYTKLE